MMNQTHKIISLWTCNKHSRYVSANVMLALRTSAESFFECDTQRRRAYMTATQSYALGNDDVSLSALVREWLALLTPTEVREIYVRITGQDSDCLTADSIKELIV